MKKQNINSAIALVLLFLWTAGTAHSAGPVPGMAGTSPQSDNKSPMVTVSQPEGTTTLPSEETHRKNQDTDSAGGPVPFVPPTRNTPSPNNAQPESAAIGPSRQARENAVSPSPGDDKDMYISEDWSDIYRSVNNQKPDSSAQGGSHVDLKPHNDKGESLEELTDRLKTYSNTPQVVEDEDYQAVEISLKDVSRIVCFTSINRTIYSKEKGMEIKTVDKNAFVKNLPKERADAATGRISVEYDRRPKEVYVVCGEKTFSLLLIPKDIPANTIYLKSSYVAKETARTFEKSTDYENMISKLIKSAYSEDIPEGYETEDIDKVLKEYQEIRLIHKRNYTGLMYQVQEYIIVAKKDININEITLLEAIAPKNPLAVSIVSPLMKVNEQTRVFMVRMLKDE